MPAIFPKLIHQSSHTHIVVGFDENKNLVFMKTFDCRIDGAEKEAIEAWQWCSENCKGGYLFTGTAIFEYIASYALEINSAE